MSPLGIASTLFSLFQSGATGSTTKTEPVSPDNGDFSSSLAVRMASLQAQSVNTLLGAALGDSATTFDFLTGTKQSASSDLMSLLGVNTSSGLSASGRNLSLFDPESGYRMMSAINSKDVTYKAQFAELSEMKTAVAGMQQAGQTLGGVNESLDNATIKSSLQTFADKYNDWVKRFDGTVKSDGVLAGTQAAEISLYELEQSVENVFNGAGNGIHGLRDLGFTIDQNTNLASLDTSRLDAVLASNKSGAINAIDEFSANFAKSAELLNSSNNFIPNRLSNLDRAIDYISDNQTSLQAEFGLGDPAKPSAQVNKALATYNQIFKI